MRRKCSCCGVLLPSAQQEHVRGGQARGNPGREQKATNGEDTLLMCLRSLFSWGKSKEPKNEIVSILSYCSSRKHCF